MALIMKRDVRDNIIPMSNAERDARVQLAAAYRIFDHIGWDELIFNHITLRVPGPERVFLINPFGLRYREVTASNLVAIDIEGNPVRPTEYPINRAGFVIHAALHGNVEGAHCVMHTHTTNGMAVACLEEGLSHDNFYGAVLKGRVAYHDFEGVTTDEGEQGRLLASVGNKRHVVLRNHGLLAWGHDVAEAFIALWTMQRACDVQIAASSAGRVRGIVPSVFENAGSRGANSDADTVAKITFDAMMREIDRIDPRYKN